MLVTLSLFITLVYYVYVQINDFFLSLFLSLMFFPAQKQNTIKTKLVMVSEETVLTDDLFEYRPTLLGEYTQRKKVHYLE